MLTGLVTLGGTVIYLSKYGVGNSLHFAKLKPNQITCLQQSGGVLVTNSATRANSTLNSASPYKAGAAWLHSSCFVLTPCFACSSAIRCRRIASSSSSAMVFFVRIMRQTWKTKGERGTEFAALKSTIRARPYLNSGKSNRPRDIDPALSPKQSNTERS